MCRLSRSLCRSARGATGRNEFRRGTEIDGKERKDLRRWQGCSGCYRAGPQPQRPRRFGRDFRRVQGRVWRPAPWIPAIPVGMTGSISMRMALLKRFLRNKSQARIQPDEFEIVGDRNYPLGPRCGSRSKPHSEVLASELAGLQRAARITARSTGAPIVGSCCYEKNSERTFTVDLNPMLFAPTIARPSPGPCRRDGSEMPTPR